MAKLEWGAKRRRQMVADQTPDLARSESPEDAIEEPDELWLWCGEKDFPWPSDAEMERMFAANTGADLVLALRA